MATEQTKDDALGDEFKKLTLPVIKWLNDNMHPHASVIITTTSAELVEGNLAYTTYEHVPD